MLWRLAAVLLFVPTLLVAMVIQLVVLRGVLGRTGLAAEDSVSISGVWVLLVFAVSLAAASLVCAWLWRRA